MTDEERKLRQQEASKRWYNKNKFKVAEKRQGKRKEEHKASYAKLLAKHGHTELARRSAVARAKNPDKHNACVRNGRLRDPIRAILNRARHSAKRRGLDFNLEREDIVIPEKCPLLDTALSLIGDMDYVPSIDRINNDLGYVKGNVWIISTLANRMKNTATKSELITFCKNGLKLFEDVISYA